MTTHRLQNKWGWSLAYEVTAALVTVRRWFRGATVGELTLTPAAAREHYRSALRQGFTTLAGDL